MVRATDFSPINATVMADPYPYYDELRRGPSATYLPLDDLWVVPRVRGRLADRPQSRFVLVKSAASARHRRDQRADWPATRYPRT